MKVIFAPDFREGNPYQQCLSDALQAEGVAVEYLSGIRRVLPLYRGLSNGDDTILHLHWPERYFQVRGDGWDWFRKRRYPLDLGLALRDRKMVVTAHNLMPHGRGDDPVVLRNMKTSWRRADAILLHSDAARAQMVREFEIDGKKCHVVPHGDLSTCMPAPTDREEARDRLGWGTDPVCLLFGVVGGYKGIEELIEFWKSHSPNARLVIAGSAPDEDYGDKIAAMVAEVDPVEWRNHFVEDEELALLLSAADCSIFNYRASLTSGAACLARSFGVPILIPERLETVDLMEPDDRVKRFGDLDESLREQIGEALSIGTSFAAAQPWRDATSWQVVARRTTEVYRNIIGS